MIIFLDINSIQSFHLNYSIYCDKVDITMERSSFLQSIRINLQESGNIFFLDA